MLCGHVLGFILSSTVTESSTSTPLVLLHLGLLGLEGNSFIALFGNQQVSGVGASSVGEVTGLLW